jgi:hypothetical protein
MLDPYSEDASLFLDRSMSTTLPSIATGVDRSVLCVYESSCTLCRPRMCAGRAERQTSTPLSCGNPSFLLLITDSCMHRSNHRMERTARMLDSRLVASCISPAGRHLFCDKSSLRSWSVSAHSFVNVSFNHAFFLSTSRSTQS